MMRLIGPQELNEAKFIEMIEEFRESDEKVVPYSLEQKNLEFSAYIELLRNDSLGIHLRANRVPSSTFFLQSDDGDMCGAVSIRHRLNKKLRIQGGHIGYGIKPSARSKGYGSRILELALGKARGLGIGKALLTCYKENLHSARIIKKNGGELESEVEMDGKVVQRYWISL